MKIKNVKSDEVHNLILKDIYQGANSVVIKKKRLNKSIKLNFD